MKKETFEQLLQQVANGWSEGDAAQAADCFTDEAVYMEPPDKQLFIGREQLFNYFGGDTGRSKPMQMYWHNIMFNEDTQTGAGEFTFVMDNQTHGVAVISVQDNKIASWREYLWTGDLSFEEFLDQQKTFAYTADDLG